jgi:hypothetical protein
VSVCVCVCVCVGITRDEEAMRMDLEDSEDPEVCV